MQGQCPALRSAIDDNLHGLPSERGLINRQCPLSSDTTGRFDSQMDRRAASRWEKTTGVYV